MSSQREQVEADLVTISVFASIIAILFALFYFVARIGFENPPAPVIAAAGVALFVLNVPVTARRWMLNDLIQKREAWYTSAPALLMAALGLLAGIGAMVRGTGAGLGAGLSPAPTVGIALVGGVMFGLTVWRWLRGGFTRVSALTLLIIGLLAGWLITVVWSGEYHSPLFVEKIVFKYASGDGPLHAAIVGMLDTHAAVSVGFHGLVPVRYHFGSHVLFVALMHLLNVPALTFYQLGFPVIMVPVFLWSLWTAALYVRAAYGSPQAAPPLHRDVFTWGMFFVLSLFVKTIGPNIAATDHHLWVYASESFALGVTLLALAVALCADVLRDPAVRMGQINTPAVRAFVLIMLPLLMAAMGLSKVSVMYVFMAICGYFFVRLGLFRYPLMIASMVALLISFVAVYNVVRVALAGEAAFGTPLQHLFMYQMAWKRPFYYVAFYAYSWLFIILRLAIKRVHTVRDLWQQLSRNELIDVEVVAITAAASALPGIAGLIFGEFFFTAIQRWVALIFLVANAPLIVRWLNPRRSGDGSLSLSRLLAAAALTVYLLAIPYQIITPLDTLVRDQLEIRHYYSSPEADLPLAAMLRTELGSGDLAGVLAVLHDDVIPVMTAHQQYAEQDPRYQLLHELQAIGMLPVSMKRDALIFIPKRNRLYWDIPMVCEMLPVLAPGLTGMPLLQGVPDSACPKTTYGGLDYAAVERHDFAVLGEAAMCVEARSLGFGEVWVIDEDAAVKKVVCDQ